MNKKISILCLVCIMITSVSFSQIDSIRTRNDKPGTPSSLRTPDNSPQNSNPVINQARPQVGSVNHGALESNKVTNITQQTDANNGVSPVYTNQPANNNLHRSTPTDSVIINGAYYQKPSNVTNPIRNQ